MIRFTMLLVSFLVSAEEIQIIDSRVDPKMSYVLVDGCAVPVLKTDFKNSCKVMNKINEFCQLNLKPDKCPDGQ